MQFTQQILANKDTAIPAKTLRQILVQSKLLERKDLFLEPSYAKPDVTVFAQIVDCGMTEILILNNTENVLIIAGKSQLGRVVKYKADAYYQVHIDTVGAAPPNLHHSLLQDVMAFSSLAELNETILDNRITCYRDPDIVDKLAKVARQFEPSLWTDTGTTVELPKDQWMDISLIANWEEKFKAGNAKVYPLRPKDCKIIDTEFDRFHCQRRMNWSSPTPFTYSCFIIYTTKADGTRKGRIIVDIRSRNRIMLPNAYLMLSQADTLADYKRATHIPTIDCPAFFHQSKVKPEQKNIFRANRMPKTLLGWPRDVRDNTHKKVADRTYVTMLTDTGSNESHHLWQLSAFAQIRMKDSHDQCHTPQFSKGQQIPAVWKIHLVILVAHLETSYKPRGWSILETQIGPPGTRGIRR